MKMNRIMFNLLEIVINIILSMDSYGKKKNIMQTNLKCVKIISNIDNIVDENINDKENLKAIGYLTAFETKRNNGVR